MKRSIGITVSAVVTLLGSILMLALGTLMIAAGFMVRGTTQPDLPDFARSMMYVTAGMIFAGAIWGIATAIGLFRLQRWSRISILIFSVLLLLIALPTIAVILVMPLPAPPQGSPEIVSFVKAFIIAVYAILGAIGVWWLVLFNRAAVKEQFREGAALQTEPGRPVSIMIIGGALLLGAASCALIAALRWPATLWGVILTGWAAVVTYAAFAAIQAVIGIGLLRFNAASRIAAIVFFLVSFANGVLFLSLPGREARFAAAFQAMSVVLPSPPPTANPPFWVGMLSSAAVTVLALWFLVTRRAAFIKPAANSGAV